MIGAATTAPKEENAGTQTIVKAMRGNISVPIALNRAVSVFPLREANRF